MGNHLTRRLILSLNDVPEVRGLFSRFAFESAGLRYSISGGGGIAAKEALISNGA